MGPAPMIMIDFMSVRFGMIGPQNMQILVGYRDGASGCKREFTFVRELMGLVVDSGGFDLCQQKLTPMCVN